MRVVDFEARDGVATATLTRSAARNAIDEDMLADLREVIDAVRADAGVNALVITGEDDSFCIGLDIDLLKRAFADPSYFESVLRRYNDVLLDLEALPVPVIAAVNGLARAGGFELILACDLVLIANEARIADHHLAFGIMPGGGATQRAPRKLGSQRANELIFTARWLSGAEAAEAGLALRSVPLASLSAEVEALCAQLRDKSRPCLAATKAAMREGAALPLRDAVAVETGHFMRYLETEPTARAGFDAYVNR